MSNGSQFVLKSLITEYEQTLFGDYVPEPRQQLKVDLYEGELLDYADPN